jgi:hypothetical protein
LYRLERRRQAYIFSRPFGSADNTRLEQSRTPEPFRLEERIGQRKATKSSLSKAIRFGPAHRIGASAFPPASRCVADGGKNTKQKPQANHIGARSANHRVAHLTGAGDHPYPRRLARVLAEHSPDRRLNKA